MRHLNRSYHVMCALLLMMLCCVSAFPQTTKEGESVPVARSHREGHLRVMADSLVLDTVPVAAVEHEGIADSLQREEEQVETPIHVSDSASFHFALTEDSLQRYLVPKRPERFIPDPKKAMWLAIVFPGGGQIYNRKYWKLPLIYGGFLGCIYAMTWNNTMYRDYSQAYIDIMDSDENTKSYENFIPARYDVNANITRLQELFKRKKNYYRRYRDLSMFCMIGVYALSIIDAYVDAELSSFDITRDLSLKVQPTIIHEKYSALRASGMSTSAYGLQCSVSF